MELELLLSQIPEVLQLALEKRTVESALELAHQYLSSNEDDQAWMLEFIEQGGPRKVREFVVWHTDGTPTSSDLEGWTSDDGPK